MKQRAQDLLVGLTDSPAEQNQQVDIRVKTELPASVAANGDNRDGLWGPRSDSRNLTDDAVQAIGEAAERTAAALAAQDVIAKLAAGLLELMRETRR